jgi:hypothetical protein
VRQCGGLGPSPPPPPLLTSMSSTGPGGGRYGTDADRVGGALGAAAQALLRGQHDGSVHPFKVKQAG